jgi:hypothetical protein
VAVFAAQKAGLVPSAGSLAQAGKFLPSVEQTDQPMSGPVVAGSGGSIAIMIGEKTEQSKRRRPLLGGHLRSVEPAPLYLSRRPAYSLIGELPLGRAESPSGANWQRLCWRRATTRVAPTNTELVQPFRFGFDGTSGGGGSGPTGRDPEDVG